MFILKILFAPVSLALTLFTWLCAGLISCSAFVFKLANCLFPQERKLAVFAKWVPLCIACRFLVLRFAYFHLTANKREYSFSAHPMAVLPLSFSYFSFPL